LESKWSTPRQGINRDRQQLAWFQRFYQDQQVYKQNPKEHSQALFTLRSVTLTWKEGTGKGEPWQANYLYLHCSAEVIALQSLTVNSDK
jgi:hypothetical protein